MTDDHCSIKALENIVEMLADIRVQQARADSKIDTMQAAITEIQRKVDADNANARLAVLEAKSNRNDKINTGIITGVCVALVTALGSAVLSLIHKVGG